MKVEVLYVEGCPNLRPARQVLERALAEQGLRHGIEIRLITDATAAAARAFAGSPTILINGCDVEPATATGVACRIYSNGTGCPPLAAVRAALQRAQQEEAPCSGPE